MTDTEARHALGAEKLVDIDPRQFVFEATPIWFRMVQEYGYPLPLEETYATEAVAGTVAVARQGVQ